MAAQEPQAVRRRRGDLQLRVGQALPHGGGHLRFQVSLSSEYIYIESCLLAPGFYVLLAISSIFLVANKSKALDTFISSRHD